MSSPNAAAESVAIVGMAGRFPGARNVQEYWHNIAIGVESISFFSDDELAASGVDIESVRNDPSYVRAAGIVHGVDLFAAGFFGIPPSEADFMDPQGRVLLECAWEALEHAGYDAARCPGSIGVYAGMGPNSYFIQNVSPYMQGLEAAYGFQARFDNQADSLATRISYRMNLRGPSVTVQSACSTSLVAVFHACQGLLTYQCDMALAGGVSLRMPQKQGYRYQKDWIVSPDGHCRAFDEQAAGTVFSSGAGLVVLKRLSDAMDDGDKIYAVIKGIAVNNDGASKVGYAAPSVDGQAEVIGMALATAGVNAESVGYVECHGTGTPLGDPIEIAGLTKAFRAYTDKVGFCAIGSVKTNIGHVDAASGIAGLIKTALALDHKLIPPSLHFRKANPKLALDTSPFYVSAAPSAWKDADHPRLAGVSSFGIGGTNAHAILEEAPPTPSCGSSRPWQLLVISARTAPALAAATANLGAHLKQNPGCGLPDVAHTLRTGRRGFKCRRALICREIADAVQALEALDPQRVVTQAREGENTPVVFMFSGQGSQYVNMGLELYQHEPTFREHVNRCAEFLAPLLGTDLRHVLYPRPEQTDEATRHLTQTSFAQPAIFLIEYAMTQLWIEWGIHPAKMIGHSVGEYVAACLAGVLSLEDALRLLAARGRLMQSLPTGGMLSVLLSEQETTALLNTDLSLAAVNGPSNCVVSGTTNAIDTLERALAQRGTVCRRLHTSHAFHSPMVDSVLDAFTNEARKAKLSPPKIPFISSLTGTWITAEQATDPVYWTRQMRHTVHFAQGRQELAKIPDHILLEVGPGNVLATLAKHPSYGVPQQVVLSSLGHVLDSHQDEATMLNALGHLWTEGVPVDWTGFGVHERRRRVALPTYPFERQRHWLETTGVPAPHVLPRETPAQRPTTQESACGLTPCVAATPIPAGPQMATRTTSESLVRATWQDVLGVSHVSPNDNFYDLGGNSLMAASVVARLEKTTKVRVDPLELRYQTLGQLAATLDERTHAPAGRNDGSLSNRLMGAIRGAMSAKTAKSR